MVHYPAGERRDSPLIVSPILLANSRLGSEGGETRGARCGEWDPLKPAHESQDSGRQGREERLEMRLALPDVPCAAQAGVAGGVREGPFNPTSRLLQVMEFGRLLTCACHLQ